MPMATMATMKATSSGPIYVVLLFFFAQRAARRRCAPWRSAPRQHAADRRPLRRVPWRALPGGAGRARGRMFHPSRVERRLPAALVGARELEVVALVSHAGRDVGGGRPRVEPRAQRPERAVVRGHGDSGESDCCTEKLAALVEHGYWI